MNKVKKDPKAMKASEINKELDKIAADRSRLTDRMIDEGRGSELCSEISGKSDELSIAIKNVEARNFELRLEVAMRYGPNPPHRLPTGKCFGPRKATS